ncbi:MAG: hypothetical protein GX493_00915 [Firmicutes bacterium]|nr:hypothetical protein [Bacillota bacterium]
MKKVSSLLSLGLILMFTVVIVGLAAPGSSTQDVSVTVNVASTFTLKLSGVPTGGVVINWDGFATQADSDELTITANAKSNWPRGYTIGADANVSGYNDLGLGVDPTEAIPGLNSIIDSILNVTWDSTTTPLGSFLVNKDTKSSAAGDNYAISRFSIIPGAVDVSGIYPGSYTMVVTFTMAPKV